MEGGLNLGASVRCATRDDIIEKWEGLGNNESKESRRMMSVLPKSI